MVFYKTEDLVFFRGIFLLMTAFTLRKILKIILLRYAPQRLNGMHQDTTGTRRKNGRGVKGTVGSQTRMRAKPRGDLL